jgi:crotonobetainyl-CoA:carnitine CoA-transferase CaiB-like acyl-CoA transferase
VWRDPQLRATDGIVELDQPDLGTYSSWGNPYRFAVTRPGPSSAGARLGGHTIAVLQEWLGMGDEDIDALITAGVVFQCGDDDAE